ncbi:MAG: hypothetical protein JHC33_14215 [Ignisphaera sp.]|nr:hypothetical protein [Ignisphaera sp.]
MANVVYNSFKAKLGNGTIDWDDNSTTNIRVALVTDQYAANMDTHTMFSDVSNQVVGTGYTAGGALLVGRAVTVDNVNNLAVYSGNNITWSVSTFTTAGAVIYKDTGTPSTSPLIFFLDFAGNKTPNQGDMTINWNVNGIFTLG